ncbi:MAG: hypothetical protein IK062_05900 [Selenomonadaceae bacterium]|nr:hypothetical protein [Selenomonadaceae bacterium]
MPTIKKESEGSRLVYTLRNNKGNELKVTDAGAKIISFRFRDKKFVNKFILKTDETAGKIFVDGRTDFDEIIWNSEDFQQGVRFTAEKDGKKVEIVYSISNDNELSIKYSAEGVQDISAELVFDGGILEGAEISPYAEGVQKEKISGEKIYDIIDKPAEVEFVEGMFGYDFGCPIDYYDAGLKNAADIFSESAGILIQAYASQNKFHVSEIGGDFAIKTSETKISDGKIQAQTVYIFKNRK